MTTPATQPQILDALTPEQEAAAALQEAMSVLTRAKVVIVTNDAEYSEADAAVAAIKNAQKHAEARRTELVKPLNDVVKKINAGFKPVDAAYEQALTCYRQPMSAYQAKLAAERAKAEKEAREERERIAAEEAKKVEDARKTAEEAARKVSESADPFDAFLAQEEAQEASQRAAMQLEESKQAIREVATMPVNVPAKVTGSASKTFTVWDYTIEDESKIEDKYWVLDLAAIARDVKALKDQFNSPGIKVTSRVEVK